MKQMERIQQPLDQLLSANSGAMMQSTKQPDSSLISQLASLMKQVKANYPGTEISPETATVWLDQWVEIVRDYNLDLFTRALKRCFREKMFLPHPADIEHVMTTIKQEDAVNQQAATVKARPIFKQLPECVNACGKLQGLYRDTSVPGMPSFEACDCLIPHWAEGGTTRIDYKK